MAVLVSILLVVVVGWVVAKAGRSGRATRLDRPAWPGETTTASPPPQNFTARTPDQSATVRLTSSPRQRPAPAAAAPAPRGLAALTRAQEVAVAGGGTTGGYAFSSQPQRRRPDRSARLFARARGPGLCSPRTP